MTFHLDLALAYACALVIFYWLASWFVPLLARALLAAICSCSRGIGRHLSGGERAKTLPHHLPHIRVGPLF